MARTRPSWATRGTRLARGLVKRGIRRRWLERFARCASRVLATSQPIARVGGHAVAGAAHALERPAESTPL